MVDSNILKKQFAPNLEAAKLPCKGYGGVRQYRWNPEINVKAAKVYVNSRSRRSMNLVRKDAADLDKMIEGPSTALALP